MQVRQELMQNYCKHYLLCNHTDTDLILNKNGGILPQICCESFTFRAIDTNLLKYFIGYFYYQDLDSKPAYLRGKDN